MGRAIAITTVSIVLAFLIIVVLYSVWAKMQPGGCGCKGKKQPEAPQPQAPQFVNGGNPFGDDMGITSMAGGDGNLF